MNKHTRLLFFSCILLLAGCNYSKKQHQTGFFFYVFVKPIDWLLHSIGQLFHSYGIAIILIVIIIRSILLPLMLNQMKQMHTLREKRAIVQDEISDIQTQMRQASTPEIRKEANQLLLAKYKEYGISPFKSILGSLPIFIQIPIILGLLACIKHPTSDALAQHPHFLWFNLMHPDIWLALLAGLLYFIQPLVNAIHYTKGQRKTYYTMMVLSPLFIIYASLHSAAAISLYWVVSASFLIVQTHFGHRRYKKQAQAAAIQLENYIAQRDQTSSQH